ncbi:hypothetical protein [Pseudomonas citronellolis]|uniref:hypothetical protein n=1 Tax=Pseudomonas citronellolis TaxID=53408 RepID=UPI00389ACF4D
MLRMMHDGLMLCTNPDLNILGKTKEENGNCEICTKGVGLISGELLLGVFSSLGGGMVIAVGEKFPGAILAIT